MYEGVSQSNVYVGSISNDNVNYRASIAEILLNGILAYLKISQLSSITQPSLKSNYIYRKHFSKAGQYPNVLKVGGHL